MDRSSSLAHGPEREPKGEGGVSSPGSLADLLRGVVSELALNLSGHQVEQLTTHFSLLVKWNAKINLTSIREPAEIATRHFGESLYLTKHLSEPKGLLVDVGSGAGFPGLPLKIAWPSVPTVLLEPNNKKATFLKEVIRACALAGIEIRTERLEQAAATSLARRAMLVTLRAVAPTPGVLAGLKRLLAPGGRAALFVSDDAASLVSASAEFRWDRPIRVPDSAQRVILLGTVAQAE